MFYNEIAVLGLGMNLEDDHVLEKIEKMVHTIYAKDGDKGTFTFNLTDLFKRCPAVFKQISIESTEEDIVKIYDTNKKKFQRMMKNGLGKAIVRAEPKRDKNGKKMSYFKFNKAIMTILRDGYPNKEVSTELEQIVSREIYAGTTLPKEICTQLASVDVEVFKNAIEVAKKQNKLFFKYVRGVYNNLIDGNKKVVSSHTNNSQSLSPSPSKDNKKNHLLDTIIPQDGGIIQEKKEINGNNIQVNNDNNTNNSKNSSKNYSNSSTNTSNSNKSYNNKKTAFHNFEETFTQYSPEELDEIIEKSQKAKFK